MTPPIPSAADWAILARHGITPENASTLTSVDVRGCPRLSALPDLPAATSVDVWHCPGLTALPDLPAATSVDVRRCPGIGWVDPRGYSLVHRAADDRFFAGCRSFTRAEALAHWGSPEYPDPERGAMFVAAINAHPAPE
jgi:hypothetical protein